MCGTDTGSTTWTNQNRTVKVNCSDSYSGCTSTSYSKDYTSDKKTDNITIQDKAGNTNTCPVNVYVDKTKPSCTLKVTSGTKGDNDWYKTSTTVEFETSKDNGTIKSGVDTYEITNNHAKKLTQSTDASSLKINGTIKDKAGNTNTCSLTIKVDVTAP